MLDDTEYFIFDGRACGDQGTYPAQLLTTGSTLEEAREDAKQYGQCAIYEFKENAEGHMVEHRWLEDCFN